MSSLLSTSNSSRATGAAASSSTQRRTRPKRSFMAASLSASRDQSPSDDDVEHRGLLHDEDDENAGNDAFLTRPDDPFAQKRARGPLLSRRMLRFIFIALMFVALAFVAMHFTKLQIAYLRLTGVPPGLYSRKGQLVVGDNVKFFIKGASWYGMEETTHLFGGLAKTTIDAILDFVKANKFNAIRVPLSIENIRANPEGRIPNVFANIDVKDAPYLHLLKHVIESAAERNILILLDIHRLNNVEVQSPGLWYTQEYPETELIQTWRKLCTEYGQYWNILGADLKNEPWNSTWHTADPKTDWKRASEIIGDAIHENCPSWTIFVEGVGTTAGKVKTNAFWSENLAAIQEYPPAVRIRKKVVLSPHVYGPSVYMQEYFKTDNFIEKMPAIWDDHFGRANKISGLATVVGEWGGKFQWKDEIWQKRFIQYLKEKELGFFYWCINPESGDTGGLLKPDWKTPETSKLNLLKSAPSTSVERHLPHFKLMRNWRA